MELVPVSIVIPSYNGLRFADQIISCMKPYYKSGYEIILVEDGSDDGIKEVFIEAFPKATYIWQENAGVADARFTGAKVATGEYIQLLDIDDTIQPEKLSTQYHHAKKYGLDFVYSGWRGAFKKENSDEITYSEWVLNDQFEDVAAATFDRWWFPPCSPIIRKESYLAVDGGDRSLKFIEDLGLWLKLYTEGYKFGYCDGKFSSYFKHENSMSLNSYRKTEMWWSDSAKVFIDTLEALEKSGQLNDRQTVAGLERLFVVNRDLAKFNLQKALKNWDYIFKLNPNFIPPKQSSLFMGCFQLLGYKNAEIIAQFINSIMKILFKKDPTNNIKGGDMYIAHNRNIQN